MDCFQIAETYIYDGAGERVMKFGPSGETVYVYDAFERLADEYSTTLQNSPCTTCYLSYDLRGDVRLVTDQNGNVVARHDFLPFGTEVPANIAGRNSQWGSTTDVEQKFTGQIRDNETGMDYFHARYYGSAFGRFTSPDPANAGAISTNPQSWNGYAYVTNNPLNAVDPTGMFALINPGKGIDFIGPGFGGTFQGGRAHPIGADPIGGRWTCDDPVRLPCHSAGMTYATPPVIHHPVNANGGMSQSTASGIVVAASAPSSTTQNTTSPSKTSTAVKTAIIVLQAATIISAVFDEGTSLIALPEEDGLALGTETAETNGLNVYRVWGDESGPNGSYWTTTDPGTVPDFRSAAGLPEANSGRFVSEGTLTDTNGVTFTPGGAAPGAGGPGGLPEVRIPDPGSQVQLTNVSGANPPF